MKQQMYTNINSNYEIMSVLVNESGLDLMSYYKPQCQKRTVLLLL